LARFAGTPESPELWQIQRIAVDEHGRLPLDSMAGDYGKFNRYFWR
jgi:hypothetical protein